MNKYGAAEQPDIAETKSRHLKKFKGLKGLKKVKK